MKVELHEGCGRIKLYWVMALTDYRTLKGMIEFKESGSGKEGRTSETSAVNRYDIPCGYLQEGEREHVDSAQQRPGRPSSLLAMCALIPSAFSVQTMCATRLCLVDTRVME